MTDDFCLSDKLQNLGYFELIESQDVREFIKRLKDFRWEDKIIIPIIELNKLLGKKLTK